MAGLSSATLERIRAASDIVDVVGSYLPLKKAGANFVALCPFHKEKTPSFSVNPHRQIFHCFGCHKGGDVFTFVKEYENIGFMDAVRRLADRAKIPVEFSQSPCEQQSRHLKDQLLEIHEQIAQRWQNCLLNEAAGQLARDYLAKRGVSPEAVKLFRLGAAPEAWDDTVNWAKSKGHDLALVEKAGLIIRKAGSAPASGAAVDASPTADAGDEASPATRGGAYAPHFYDRFRGRLMFPICNEQGRVIGFSGRVLAGDEKTAKYVNSPETLIFTKSRVFFGLDKSKRALLDAGFAVVCEGQLDLIACFMGGVQNVVAPQGTAFTDQHARILKRYVDEVVLCFDSDEAGQNAAVRSLDHLLASGLAVRVAVVPAPHDPDSFIKANGGEAFRKLVESAEGFFDYFLNRLGKLQDANSDKGRLAILRGMAEALHKTANVVLIDTYAQKTALRLGVSPEAVRAEFAKFKVQGSRFKVPESESGEPALEPETEIPRPPAQEFWLLKLLLLHDELVSWAALHLDVNWISHPAASKIVEQRLAAQTKETWKSLAVFLDECETPEMRSLVTEAVAEDRKIPNPEQQLADVTLKLRNQFLDRQIAALTHKVSQPEIPPAEQNQLLHERETLREQKRAPLK
ncbi:MAG TPA: CHC2 zinc finger domain-containing protein [Verrucomicrobiae bacterium]|nr:CHC2 zinc finger domain-containing protein [Verrucomicrobiae bacterium]